jgi:hypothetical protein
MEVANNHPDVKKCAAADCQSLTLNVCLPLIAGLTCELNLHDRKSDLQDYTISESSAGRLLR